MKNESFIKTIELPKSTRDVFNCITEVMSWWSTDFEGRSKHVGDAFIIHHPGQHYSKQKLTEVIPDNKIVWSVTESKLPWLKANEEEWTDTKMIFELATSGDKTVLRFTHDGLTQEKECYVLCEMGWNLIIGDWLLYFIVNGKPSPDMAKAAEIRNQALKENTKSK